VLHIHRVLREALQHAVRWQMLSRNPADAVEDVRRLLSVAASTTHGPLVYTAVMTGLRRGDLLGLCWQDVDLDAGVIHVRQTAQWLPGQGSNFRSPKRDSAKRLPVPSAAPPIPARGVSWGRPWGGPRVCAPTEGASVPAAGGMGNRASSLTRKGGTNVSKQDRFKEYTRSVWRQSYEGYERWPAGRRDAVRSAVDALDVELRRCASEDELHACYWESGDWPAEMLRRHLRSDPGQEALLELEDAAFWLRYRELAES
jgi:hypothetical protein